MVGKCTTNGQGVCSVPLNATYVPMKGTGPEYDSAVRPMVNGQLLGLISHGSQAVLVPNAGSFFPRSRNSFKGTLVADRQLVRPGESLHLAGYLQQQRRDGTLALPEALPTVTVQLGHGWDPAHPNEPVPFIVNVTADTGSFHLVVPVSEDITMGVYSVSVMVTEEDGGDTKPLGKRPLLDSDTSLPRTMAPGARRLSAGVASGMAFTGKESMSSDDASSSQFYTQPSGPQLQVDSMTITVADPRPPTAELELQLSSWVKPGTDVVLKAVATSYLGTSVASAPMTVTWSTPRAQSTQVGTAACNMIVIAFGGCACSQSDPVGKHHFCPRRMACG